MGDSRIGELAAIGDDAAAGNDEVRRRAIYAVQDDCLTAIIDGKPLPTRKLQALPPWRAVMLARLAARHDDGVVLEQGTIGQLEAEAVAVGGAGVLGDWWTRT